MTSRVVGDLAVVLVLVPVVRRCCCCCCSWEDDDGVDALALRRAADPCLVARGDTAARSSLPKAMVEQVCFCDVASEVCDTATSCTDFVD